MAEALPIKVPMEALLAAELPDGPGWQFEPKWDGFRCLAHRDGDTVTLTSKSDKPLARYFPEVAGRRFRHGTGFLRWRPDKEPRQCTFEQLAPDLRPSQLKELFAA